MPTDHKGGQELNALEPLAFIVEPKEPNLDKRRVMLIETYDPRNPDFWINEEAEQLHRVTPLYALDSIASLVDEQDKEIERLRGLVRDALEDETEFDTEWDKAARAVLKETGG